MEFDFLQHFESTMDASIMVKVEQQGNDEDDLIVKQECDERSCTSAGLRMEPDISDLVDFGDTSICTIEMKPVPLDISSQAESTQMSALDSNDAAKRFKCVLCSETFARAGHLRQHTFIRHYNRSRNRRCDNNLNPSNSSASRLGPEGSQRDARKDGSRSVQFKGKTRKYRSVAQPSKYQSSETKDHMKTVSNKRTKASADHVESTQPKANTTTVVKRFKCDTCDKEFKIGGHLIRHVRVHSGERPFKCNVCDKAFKDSSGLTRHQRIHLRERPFECDICKKAFVQGKDLRNHKRVHTGERPYKCETCNKAFSSSSYLAVHVRTHTGEKPYTCEICQRSFTGSTTLSRHRRTHTGEKPYKCNLCKKAFTRPATLQNHQKSHVHREIDDEGNSDNPNSESEHFESESDYESDHVSDTTSDYDDDDDDSQLISLKAKHENVGAMCVKNRRYYTRSQPNDEEV